MRFLGAVNLSGFARRGFLIVFAVFTIARVPDCLGSDSDLGRMRAALTDSRERIESLRADNARRAFRIERLKNSAEAIIDIARDEQGFVFPDELVLRMETDTP